MLFYEDLRTGETPLSLALKSKNIRCIQQMVNLLASLQKQEGLNMPILDENMIGLIQSGVSLNELMQINTSMTEIRGK